MCTSILAVTQYTEISLLLICMYINTFTADTLRNFRYKCFLLKLISLIDTATRREISVYTLCSRWCILLNLAYSAHKNVTLCYL